MPKWYGGSTLNPDELIPPREQWRGQWERTLRWFDRVNTSGRKAIEHELDANDMDVNVAFFQNCYHLKDWISVSRPDLAHRIDDLFQNHFEMGACRDICNGFKHKALTRATHDKDFNLYREYDYSEIMSGGTDSAIKYRAAFADGAGVRKLDWFELAENCMKTWQRFLADTALENGGHTLTS